MIKRQKKNNEGFTLVEVLVSLVLFSIGMLGVALQYAKGISNTINTEVHSSVMQIATKTIEPLNIAASQNNAALQLALNNLNTTTIVSNFATNNSDQKNFTLSLVATDDTGADLTTINVGAWRAPITVVLTMDYIGKDSQAITFNTTHVLTN